MVATECENQPLICDLIRRDADINYQDSVSFLFVSNIQLINFFIEN